MDIAMITGFGLVPAFIQEAPVNHPVWRVINLAVFVLILVYIFRNKLKIGQFFENRAAGIAGALEQAKREKEEAERKLKEIDSRLSLMDQEVARIKQEAEHEAEREAERVRAEAKADAEKIQQLARREIEGAMVAARAELRAFVAEHSVDMAEAQIRRNIKPEDEARMLHQYANELAEVNNER